MMKKATIAVLFFLALTGFFILSSTANAYDTYSGGCQICHGPFSDPISLKPGNKWLPAKHDVHMQMVGFVCETCHLDPPTEPIP